LSGIVAKFLPLNFIEDYIKSWLLNKFVKNSYKYFCYMPAT
jgi:hypothetical protein